MGVPLYVVFFPLLLFTFNLSLIFVSLITHVSRYVPPWVYAAWGSLCSLDLADYFLSQMREFFSYYLLRYFLRSFLSLFSFWDPYNGNVCAFTVVPTVSLAVFFFCLFVFISIFCSVAVICTILSSSSFIHSSASVILLLIPSGILFISVCWFLNSSRSLVNASCIFSWDPGSSSLSLFWNLFLEGYLSPFNCFLLGFYLVPSSGI